YALAYLTPPENLPNDLLPQRRLLTYVVKYRGAHVALELSRQFSLTVGRPRQNVISVTHKGDVRLKQNTHVFSSKKPRKDLGRWTLSSLRLHRRSRSHDSAGYGQHFLSITR